MGCEDPVEKLICFKGGHLPQMFRSWFSFGT